jgi:hypothetical protein
MAARQGCASMCTEAHTKVALDTGSPRMLRVFELQVKAIAAGFGYGVALLPDGSVRSWVSGSACLGCPPWGGRALGSAWSGLQGAGRRAQGGGRVCSRGMCLPCLAPTLKVSWLAG